MKFADLSPEDQALVNTQFDTSLEKEASEEASLVQEMYKTGHDQLAVATADALDKLAEEANEDEGEDEEEKMDEESEKKASGLASFIERGYFDGLRKLGSERYGDENHYLYSFAAEKLAAAGQTAAAKSLLQRMWGGMKAAPGKVTSAVKGEAARAKELGAKGYAKDLAGKAHAAGKGGGYHVLGGGAVAGTAGYAKGRKDAQK